MLYFPNRAHSEEADELLGLLQNPYSGSLTASQYLASRKEEHLGGNFKRIVS